jgi:hypothetical protein
MANGRHPARVPAAAPAPVAPAVAPPASQASVPRPARPADERHAALQEVACDRCAAMVLVAKFSPQHTSVQWTLAATAACAEFSAREAAGERSALIDTCASLRDSIDRAVAEGRLEVTPP